MDNDGDIDILYRGSSEPVSWLQNNGSNGFAIKRISTIPPPNYDGAIIAADFDKTDSTLEVVMFDSSLHYYPNHLSSSAKINIKALTNGRARSLFPADINSDGHIDFLVADFGNDKVAWFQNEGNGFDTTSIARVIDTNLYYGGYVGHEVRWSVFAIDMDRDGDTDVIAGGRDEIRWYENDGSQNFTRHQVAYYSYANFTAVRAADIDNDGNIDIVAATYENRDNRSEFIDNIAWYKLDLTNNTVTKHTVAALDTLRDSYARDLKLADINQDGNIDIVALRLYGLAWFENQDSGTKFTQHVIEDNLYRNPRTVAVANFTGDEQLDIAIDFRDGYDNHDIRLYTNTTPPP